MDSESDELSISDYGNDSESTCSLYPLAPTETYVEGDDDSYSLQALSEAEVRTALAALSAYSYDHVKQLTAAKEDTEMDVDTAISACNAALEGITRSMYS
ncbi:hypothetical protein GCK32_002373 [Trichostrongylus colubriformis]|uniref:Uncharacterized protein n=1 Tax=Trichostrongylus colubriformis TaxID=6319 RepID=A0AAN8IEB8_TRICO